MLGRAKKILASELMYARHVDAQEATELLEDLLAESGQLGVARSAIGHAANDHVDRALDGRPGIEPPSGRMASTRTDAPDYRLR
jgi:hypothetical protein